MRYSFEQQYFIPVTSTVGMRVAYPRYKYGTSPNGDPQSREQSLREDPPIVGAAKVSSHEPFISIKSLNHVLGGFHYLPDID